MSENDIEVCKNVEPHEVTESVKSKAVVRYAVMEVPATFNRLQCNTNLNLPPSNWLTSAGTYGLHQSLYQVPGFTSFRLAHMFLDCVGDVDVVSDAENIKKLLKLAYSPKDVISMLVHKVGSSLLLDEFDIQNYLMRRSDDDWNWLHKFIIEKLLASGVEPNNFCLKDKSRQAIQSKNLLSKFLYYSLQQSLTDTTPTLDVNTQQPRLVSEPFLPEPKVEEKVPDPQTSHSFNRNVQWTFEDIRMLIGTDMPIFGGPNRPCISLRLRDMSKPINVLTGIDYWLDNLMCNVPEVVMCYHLDGIVQKYEIIKTEDLPYLENSQFSPQVVRNMAHNILAFLKANATKEGHTYWLFKARNDDLVKLYDLTTLCENQTENDQSANHSRPDDEKPENPFIVPVAMLLYSVARNIKNTTQRITPKIAGNIRALLENSIKLLPRERYPQIITSSHYILSDLYIPAGVDPKKPIFDDGSGFESDSVYEDDDDDVDVDEENDSEHNYFGESVIDDFSTKELSQPNINLDDNIAIGQISEMSKYHFENGSKEKSHMNAPLPLLANVEERCTLALEHINAGISCLQFFNKCEDDFIKESEERAKAEEKQRIIHEEQNPNMAKPYKPIVLPYETLTSHQEECCSSSSNSKAQCKNEPNNKLIKTNFNGSQKRCSSWTTHLKLLLVEKACLVYATLAEQNYVTARYGACLKAIHMSYRCQTVLMKYMENIVSQKSCLLGRAGDCLFQLAKNWNGIDEALEQYNENITLDENINSELEKDLTEENLSNIITPTKNAEQLMTASCTCYDDALSAASDDDEHTQKELLRRLGNVSNELGLKYMYWAQDEYSKSCKESINENESGTSTKNDDELQETPLYVQLAMKSYDSLMRGIAAFTFVEDKVNLAFLYCNMGRYMRFRAHLNANKELTIARQKKFYAEAFEYYEKAKTTLDSRKRNPEMWDLFNWELCTATFSLATLLQNAMSADKNDIFIYEKDVLEYLQKTLKLCDIEHFGPRQVLYLYRTGVIHRLIAAYHLWQFNRSHADLVDNSTHSRTSLQLCKIHFEKATTIFETLHEANDLLVTHLERLALQELLIDSASQSQQKIKLLEAALDISWSAKLAFKFAIESSLTQSSTAECLNKKNQKTLTTCDDESYEKVNESTALSEEFMRNARIFETRLQYILKTLIKLLLTTRDPKKRVETYKKMYMEALKSEVNTKRTIVAEEGANENIQSDGEMKDTIKKYIINLLSLIEGFEAMNDTFKTSKITTK